MGIHLVISMPRRTWASRRIDQAWRRRRMPTHAEFDGGESTFLLAFYWTAVENDCPKWWSLTRKTRGRFPLPRVQQLLVKTAAAAFALLHDEDIVLKEKVVCISRAAVVRKETHYGTPLTHYYILPLDFVDHIVNFLVFLLTWFSTGKKPAMVNICNNNLWNYFMGREREVISRLPHWSLDGEVERWKSGRTFHGVPSPQWNGEFYLQEPYVLFYIYSVAFDDIGEE